MKTLEFFFDLSSPYSYLAATQVEAVCERAGARLLWKPMLLGAVFKAVSNTMPAAVIPKAQYMLKDLTRWAAHYGVPFRMSSRFPVNALKAMRLIVAAEASEKNAALALALFRAVWVDDRDVTAEDELRAIAGEVGLDGGPLLAAIETQEVKDKLRAYTDQAIARGVFGAPALIVGSELFWGNDRLHFVEEALRSG